MGVSSNPGIDLDAVVNGGEAFVQRLAELQGAAAAYKKALDDLNLGKDVRAARDEVGRVLAEAKEKRDVDLKQLADDITTARASLKEWSDKTTREASATLDAAQVKMKEADEKLAAGNAAYVSAKSIITDAQAQADDLVGGAQKAAAKLVADAGAAADSITSEATKLKIVAQARMDEASALKARYTEALAKLQGVIAATG